MILRGGSMKQFSGGSSGGSSERISIVITWYGGRRNTAIGGRGGSGR